MIALLSAATSRRRPRRRCSSCMASPTVAATSVATSTTDWRSSALMRFSSLSPSNAGRISSIRETSSWLSELRSWNSSSTPRLKGALLPKFCSIGAATIAAMEVSDVEVQGTRVRVETWGEEAGKPLFYWHGGGGGSEETPVLGPPLGAAGYTLYAVDAPGYGGSPALQPEDYALPRLAELGAGLIRTLGLEPAIWLGFSWGASVGVHTAALFPSAVRALGLLDGG